MLKKQLCSIALLAMSLFVNAQINVGEKLYLREFPVAARYNYSYSQFIYPANVIKATASGRITGIKFYAESTINLSNTDEWEVYLAHTDKATFSSNQDWTPQSSLTKVFGGTISADTNGTISITFNTPFEYDHQKNLMVAIMDKKASANSYQDRFYNFQGSQRAGILLTQRDPINVDALSPYYSESVQTLPYITIDGLSANPVVEEVKCPKITYPAPNETGVSPTPTFTWEAVSGSKSYTVRVGTKEGYGDTFIGYTNGLQYPISNPFQNNTQYYLTVLVQTSAGLSKNCTSVPFVVGTLSTANVDANNGVVVYPTLFRDEIHIKNSEKVGTATIYDVSGKIVKDIIVNSSSLSLSDLAVGNYFISLKLKDGETKTIRIVKTN